VLLAIWREGSVWTLTPRHLLWVDMALGPAIACLLIGLAAGRPAPLVRLLDSRPIRGLGLCSYSVYLLHEPIVVVFYSRIVAPRYHHGTTAFLVMVALVVPATIALAWIFASVFERPFLHPRSGAPPNELRLPAT
jgi:peptidoglycan/LPS O-acetylase OafA/YrhL